jgi:serine/threonine protein kinase
MFISSKQFFSLYPKGKLLGQGTYAKVYEGKDYVVKETSVISSFIVEINFYSVIKHENMVPLYHACQQDGLYYLSLGKGENIVKALNRGDIKIEDINKQLYYFLAYIHSQGYVHGDIKPENTVYYNGKACMIDFGLSQKCMFINGEYKYFSINQSPSFRDPEMCLMDFNSQKCELYALARTISLLIRYDDKSVTYAYFYQFCQHDSFLAPYYKTLNKRQNISKPKYSDDSVEYKFTPDHKKAYNKLMKFSYKCNYILFMCIDLLNRLPCKYLKRYKDIYNLCCAIQLKENVIINDLDDIINNLQGRISYFNYWDYAPDGISLCFILGDILNGSLEKGKIRKVKIITNVSKFSHDIKEIIDENIDYQEVKVYSTSYNTVNIWENIIKEKSAKNKEGDMLKQLSTYPNTKELKEIIYKTCNKYKLSYYIKNNLLPLTHPLTNILSTEKKYFLIVENVNDIKVLNLKNEKIALYLKYRFDIKDLKPYLLNK